MKTPHEYHMTPEEIREAGLSPKPTELHIKWAREVGGHSQTQAAKSIGVQRDTFRKWEYQINPMPAPAWTLYRFIVMYPTIWNALNPAKTGLPRKAKENQP